MGEVVRLEIKNNIVEDFLSGFRSKDTKSTYLKAIKSFFRYEVVGEREIREIKFIDVKNYIKKMIDEEKSNNTVRTNLAGLKTFFKYCKYEGIVKENCFDGDRIKELLKVNLDRDVIDKGIALSKEEVEKILNEVKRIGINRDYLIIKMLFVLGIRRSELVGLRWNDFKEYENKWFIVIRGKGRKERELEVKEELMELIIEEFEWKYGIIGNCSRRLFEMTDGNIEKIVKKYVSRIGVKIAPHDCRRTAITRLIINGAPIDIVKNYSGHKKIETLMDRYYKPIMNREKNASNWMDL